jgi:hypothetical protein
MKIQELKIILRFEETLGKVGLRSRKNFLKVG